MATSTDPRHLLRQLLALVGVDGGNDRALANARAILDGLQEAREQAHALEVRIEQRAPTRTAVLSGSGGRSGSGVSR